MYFHIISHFTSHLFILSLFHSFTLSSLVRLKGTPFPSIWILHEWWTDAMIEENLKLRNIKTLTLSVVKEALSTASHVVCVCNAQRDLYKPSAKSSAIYVGVPAPASVYTTLNLPPPPSSTEKKVVTFLTLGIVCPRKNQVWAVEQFKKFAGTRTDVRHVLVGARYIRTYEGNLMLMLMG
jgi:glycosyltransferase involved in cell wall biosynthesis